MTLQERINAIQNSQELTDEQKTVELTKINNEFEKAEQMIKDNQGAFTRANQGQIDMAKKLVELNPASIDDISDENVRNKIIKEKWGSESLEELKIMFPNYNKVEKSEEDEEVDELQQLKQKVKLMEHNSTKTKINEEIDNTIVWEFKDAVATIPDYRQKLNEELKYISNELSPKERVNRALRLVLNSSDNPATAYAVMQGVSGFSANQDGDNKDKVVDKSTIKGIFEKNRI